MRSLLGISLRQAMQQQLTDLDLTGRPITLPGSPE